MAGIYIHIPFCSKACHYCNFHFSTSLHRKDAFLKAIRQEIASKQFPVTMQDPLTISTLYIGGGTPSLLSSNELYHLIQHVKENYSFETGMEITLEANPDDISSEKLTGWKQAGINRLSIGVQSFRQQDLEWMNRAHSAIQATQAIELARQAGFDNLTIDLIYGTPTMDDATWLENLEIANTLGITHLSCYALTVEEKTALHYFIAKGKVQELNEEKQVRHFEMLTQWAKEHGWEQYEISNLCRPGHRSKHNSAYWAGTPYLGFGPSAHSFDGKNNRWMAVANNALYIQAWLENKGAGTYETETLTAEQQLNERIMTGLRRIEGVSIDPVLQTISAIQASPLLYDRFIKKAEKFETEGLCRITRTAIQLTETGKLQADAMAAGLFF